MQLRNIPSVEAVIRTPGLDAVITAYPREWVIDVIRETIAKNRQDVLAGEEVKGDTSTLEDRNVLDELRK